MTMFIVFFLISLIVLFFCMISDNFAWVVFTLLCALAISANIMCIYQYIFVGA